MTQQYISSTGPVQAEVKSNDRPLTEIALGAGFYDQSHFSNAFRRHASRWPD